MVDAHSVARDQLQSFISRIENLEGEKKAIAEDIKSVYQEAAGTGFDVKIMKKVIARRKKDKDELAEEDALMETYMISLGMIQRDLFEDAA